MRPILGINIDHVATLRKQRDEDYPQIRRACEQVLKARADQVTIHLREDRRHIQDKDVEDVRKITKDFGIPLNLEMGACDEILNIAIETRPDWVCLVPEKREEKTTEGGLDLLDQKNFQKISNVVKKLKDSIHEVKVSLFVEANLEIIDRCTSLGIDAVEIHTGHYAESFLKNKNYDIFIQNFKNCHERLSKTSIFYHAGHGLTFESIIPLLELNIFREYNVGHWIIAESIFNGLEKVVSDFSHLFQKKEYDL